MVGFSTERVRACFALLAGFDGICAHCYEPALASAPLTVAEATERVESWLAQPCVRLVAPTEQHWPLLRELLRKGRAPGNLVSDAHLAALAIEHNGILCSTDADFARFPGLKWLDPLREAE